MDFHVISLTIFCSLVGFYIIRKLRIKSKFTSNRFSSSYIAEKTMVTNNLLGELTDPNYVPEKLRGKKYLAKSHNVRVKEVFLQKRINLEKSSTAVFIAGANVEPVKYCDTFKPFKQNQYFYYLTGCYIPGCSVLFNFRTEKLTLFLPNVNEDDIVWGGEPVSIEEALKLFDVDEVLYASEIEHVFKSELEEYQVFTTDLDDVESDFVKQKLISSNVDLFFALDEARLIKDWYEIEMIRRACQISDKCHYAVMSNLPIEKNELHLEAEFRYHAIRQGARSLGYDPICCSGLACGTLHYVKNSEDIEGQDSILIDAGAEWKGYTSDVTRCFPTSGKFTKEHREIYEAVLDMQTQVMENIKPGASWDDLHLLSHKVLIKRLLKLGIFKKEFSEEEILKRRVTSAFYPHGLGHMLGLDVHDVAGNADYEDPDPLFSYLRIRRKLEANMVLTNEPGCYFNKFLLGKFLNNYPERLEVVDQDILQKYMYVGGVRIEDDVLVTESGCENLTGITSDPNEIEKIVTAGLSKPQY